MVKSKGFYNTGNSSCPLPMTKRLSALVPQLSTSKPSKKKTDKENLQVPLLVKARKNAKPKNNSLQVDIGENGPGNFEQPKNVQNQEQTPVVYGLEELDTFEPLVEDVSHSPTCRKLSFQEDNACTCSCARMVRDLVGKVGQLEAKIDKLKEELKEGLKDTIAEAMKEAIQQSKEEWQEAAAQSTRKRHDQAIQYEMVTLDEFEPEDNDDDFNLETDPSFHLLDMANTVASEHLDMTPVPSCSLPQWESTPVASYCLPEWSVEESRINNASMPVLSPGTPVMSSTPAPLTVFGTPLPDIPLAVINVDKDNEIYKAVNCEMHQYVQAIFQEHVPYDLYCNWTKRVNIDGSRKKVHIPNNLREDILSRCRTRFRIGKEELTRIKDTLNGVLCMQRKHAWRTVTHTSTDLQSTNTT